MRYVFRKLHLYTVLISYPDRHLKHYRLFRLSYLNF